MNPSDFHIGVLPNRPTADVAAIAESAEALGFGGLWVADSQSIFRDAWQALAVAAKRTARLFLASGVTNPVTRHPAVTAGAIATGTVFSAVPPERMPEGLWDGLRRMKERYDYFEHARGDAEHDVTFVPDERLPQRDYSRWRAGPPASAAAKATPRSMSERRRRGGAHRCTVLPPTRGRRA